MADAKTTEAGKPEVPKLMRSFSKGYQKTKEALRKGFTTPRGTRTFSGRMASTEIPDMEPSAPPEAPEVPSKPVKEGLETGATAATDVAVKATVKASADGATPVEIKLEPVASSKPLAQLQEPMAPGTPTSAPPSAPAPAAPKSEAPVPAPTPAEPPAPAAPKPEEPAVTANADAADKVQAPQEEVPAEEEAAVTGSEPPEVRVLINGVQTDAAKPEAEAEKPEPVNLHVEPVKRRSGGKAKKAVLGIFALAAVSAVSHIVRGKVER